MKFSLVVSFLFTFFFVGSCISAQEDTPAWTVEEIGLRLVNLQDFSFIYKKELSDGSFRRIRLVSGDISFASVQTVNLFSLGGAVAIGKEKRVPVSSKLVFHHGWEPGFAFSLITESRFTSLTVNPFIGYVIGFQLAASDRFTLGLEVIPTASFSFTVPNQGLANSFSANVGFNTSAVGLTGTYRFVRK